MAKTLNTRDDIEDINITSDSASNNPLSREKTLPEFTKEKIDISHEMLAIWNKILPEKAKTPLSKYLKTQLESCFQYDLDGSIESWKTICKNFKTSKFLMGEAEGVRIKPDLLWLLDARKPYLQNVLHKSYFTYDDRISSKSKVKTPEELMQEIKKSNDSSELKSIKLDILNISPLCYLGFLRHSFFELNDVSLKIIFATGYARDQVFERVGDTITNLLKEKHNRSLEVTVDPTMKKMKALRFEKTDD